MGLFFIFFILFTICVIEFIISILNVIIFRNKRKFYNGKHLIIDFQIIFITLFSALVMLLFAFSFPNDFSNGISTFLIAISLYYLAFSAMQIFAFSKKSDVNNVPKSDVVENILSSYTLESLERIKKRFNRYLICLIFFTYWLIQLSEFR